MDNILVTGGFGFLGAHLVKELINDGHKVVVFDLAPPPPGYEIEWLLQNEKEKITFVKGNVTDLSSIIQAVKTNKITKIVHAAVVNDLDILENNPLLTMKINVEGTLNVLEAARLFEIEKVVLISSISVYTAMEYEPMDERHPVHSPTEGPTLLSYSSSKLSAEAFGLHYWSTYGMDVVSLRLSAVYGLGMKYPMYIKPMVENAVKKENTHFDWGKNSKRDYTYVKDVVKAIQLTLTSSTKQKILNIATGKELISPIEMVPLIQALEPSVSITFGNERNLVEEKSATTRGILSTEAAEKELNFVPEYTINRGIEDYFSSYQFFKNDK
ncbi:NAD-dependent epimerase/dehydratase family protein [Alkalihalobacterium alkalinitrilicum]|uniref:NAD-dependent epimerase/dehydratase family protein n=1 Tax=Alkalihalobacterium alkalinitrilicum TaxID=427920 RepID=UPI0013034D3A|nr:NAD(P)-dependent oxidoreductase [Alkalihalobacterium alkalinitrilicum]